MTLTVDLGTRGHTHSLYDLSHLQLYTCCRLDLGVDSNIYSVEDLKNPNLITWPRWLKMKVKHMYNCIWPFISMVVHHTHIYDLCSDSEIFEAWDIKNVEIIYVSGRFDLGIQDHTDFSYDFAYLRLYAFYWPNLGVDSYIINVEDFKKSISDHLTSLVDLNY